MKILYIDAFWGFSREMLFGAILSMHDMSSEFVQEDKVLRVQNVLRSSIECVSATVSDKENSDITAAAIETAVKEMGIDYIMCSFVPLGDNADGEVISALENGGIRVYPSDSGAWILPEEARFLASIVSECAAKPDMNITAVGYGADMSEDEAFLCVTVGEYFSDCFLEKQYEYGEYV